ncbi:hypothetical protein SAY86_024215 [Trapa natans]|uniref:Inositol-tetrakisphosphate 1-kinase n=1 Tax=Trapa natans TaxID=22666 RepID=A0AAN7MBZ1_TRANT|nr:hypothetical protein SAY86_024215 [Trapa natans]
MRLSGEGHGEEELNEEMVKGQEVCVPEIVVGYALTSKKKMSFLQPEFEALARNKEIYFVAIDLGKPLAEQGPFDILLHKLPGKEWGHIIEDYQKKHPEVAVIDPPYAIEHLHNRQSMLEDVAKLDLSDCNGKVGIPKHLIIEKDPQSIALAVEVAGLRFPLVAKPLVVDGSAKSHQLFLAYNQTSLSELEPPLVLQEFVNHGSGLLFKIFVVGEAIKVVRRFSLPNISKQEVFKVDSIFRFPRVSSAAASAEEAELDPGITELPPTPLLQKLARELRSCLGLQLFNIDMIREYGTKDVYYVIDINYFPGKWNTHPMFTYHLIKTGRCFHLAAATAGYGKVPDYQHVFTEFLLSLCPNKKKGPPASEGKHTSQICGIESVSQWMDVRVGSESF